MGARTVSALRGRRASAQSSEPLLLELLAVEVGVIMVVPATGMTNEVEGLAIEVAAPAGPTAIVQARAQRESVVEAYLHPVRTQVIECGTAPAAGCRTGAALAAWVLSSSCAMLQLHYPLPPDKAQNQRADSKCRRARNARFRHAASGHARV